MSEETRAVGSIAFGSFEVDLGTEELRRKGLPVRLPMQSFQVLRLLLGRPGELVSRQELQRALWPNDSFGDFEHGLNAAVNRLREALGDSADAPRFVETLPRRGYRFIARVDAQPPPAHTGPAEPSAAAGAEIPRETVPAEAPIVPASPHVAPSGTSGFSRVRPLPLLLGVAVLSIAGLLVAAWHRRAIASPGAHQDANSGYDYSAVQVTPLTALPGTELGPTFSPDGSHVAFAWDGGNPDKTNPYDLYVKVIGSERVEQLTHRPSEYLVPAWSPDGRNIAFSRVSPESTGIFLISALGGPERKLADTSIKYALTLSLSWSPDGQLLAFATDAGVRELNISDGNVGSMSAIPDCQLTGTGTPAFSPDGQWIAFSCYGDQSYDLDVMPVHGGAVKRLTRVYDIPMPIAWSTDSARIFYSEGGHLFAIRREGGGAQLLPFAHAAIHPAVARQGDRLAYAEETTNINLWRMDLHPNKEGATSLITATSREQRGPAISPDGRELAFESERSGRHDVWVSKLDGSEAIELGNFKTLTGSPRWSPDGRQIVFDSRETGTASLYLVDPQVGVPRRIDTGDTAASVPQWSRDGRWIYFNSVAKNGLSSGGIFKSPVAGGPPQRVTSTPGFNAQEDKAGRTLYLMADATNAPIHAIDLITGKERKVEGMPLVDTPTDWVVASRGIYFVDPAAKPATINFFEFATHRVIKRMPLSKPAAFWGGLSLSPDETWLAYAQVDRNESDLMLAEPFR